VTLLLEQAGSLETWLRAPLDPRIVCFETTALPENGEALPDAILAGDTETPGIDYRLANPAEDFPTVYQLSQLAPKFPVRLRLPLQPGTSKALRLAISLQIEVLLEPGQPDPAAIQQLAEFLETYLHGHDTESPIEPFHALFSTAIHDDPLNLWEVSEENPMTTVELDAEGEIGLPGRLRHREVQDIESFQLQFRQEADAHPECQSCEHRARCRGFFKWPDPAYDCGALRAQVLDPLIAAAMSLRQFMEEDSHPS